ncbi:MAG TPA: hypothetical protein VGC76_05855 [Pyrinomonadaceae bacterium]|jgi:hypothetical protein
MFDLKLKMLLLLPLFAITACFPAHVAAQRIKNGESDWYWRTKPDKDNVSYQLSLSLKIKGKIVTGFLEARGLENEEWNGGDGAATPFVGRVVGNTIQIEYNNADWRNAESDDFFKQYLRPNKNKRFTATLKFRGKFLELLQIYGRHQTGYPTEMTMVTEEDLDKTGK